MTPGATRVTDAVAHVLVAGIAAALLALGAGRTFSYSMFTDRDLARAVTELPVLGAELSGGPGARVPGSLLGALFGLPQLLGSDAHGVFVVQVALFAASLLVLHATATRWFGAWAGLLAVLLAASADATLQVVEVLWNPGLLPLPVAVSLYGLARCVAGRDGRGLPWLVGGAAAGAQLHLSAGLWGLACLPAVALARPRGWRRGASRALLVVAVLYLPYLLAEAATGWENTRRLFGQDALATSAPSQSWSPARLRAAVGWLAGDPDRLASVLPAPAGLETLWRVAWRLPAVLALLGGWVALVRASDLSEDGPRRSRVRLLAALAGALLLALLPYGGGVGVEVAQRYVTALVAPLALLAAGSAAAVVRSARVRHPALGAAALALVAGMAGVRVGVLPWFPQGAWSWSGFAGVQARLDEVRARTGWTLAETAGRTAWLRLGDHGQVGELMDWPPVDHLLLREGATFPGSLPPPCALVLDRDPEPRHGEAPWVASVVGAPIAAVEAPVALAAGGTLVRYAPSSGRCPTTMVQRYVDTPAEASLRRLYGGLGCGATAELSVDEGRRVAVALHRRPDGEGACDPFLLGVDLVPEPGGLRATLHGNQLRGLADNHGWFSPAALLWPTLRLEPAGGGPARRLVLEQGVVGWRWALTPLSAEARLPAGAWRVVLEGEVVDVDDLRTRPPTSLFAEPFQVTLVERLDVP